MLRRSLIVCAIAIFSLLSHAADPCISGVPVGKRPGPYSFLVATGPQRGQSTCYICEQHEGGKPAAVVFARNESDPLAKLLTKLEAMGAKQKESGFKVWMTKLSEKADLDQLAKWSQQHGLKGIPIGAYEGIDGPPSYHLNKDADVTVIFFTKEKVVANFAYRAGELDDKAVAEVLQSSDKLFPGK